MPSLLEGGKRGQVMALPLSWGGLWWYLWKWLSPFTSPILGPDFSTSAILAYAKMSSLAVCHPARHPAESQTFPVWITLLLCCLSVAHKSNIFHTGVNRPQFNRKRTQGMESTLSPLVWVIPSTKVTLLERPSMISVPLTDTLIILINDIYIVQWAHMRDLIYAGESETISLRN